MASHLARLPSATAPWHEARGAGASSDRPSWATDDRSRSAATPSSPDRSTFGEEPQLLSGSFGEEYFEEEGGSPRRGGLFGDAGWRPRGRSESKDDDSSVALGPSRSPSEESLDAAGPLGRPARPETYVVVQTHYRDTVINPPCDVAPDSDDGAWGFFLDMDKDQEPLPENIEEDEEDDSDEEAPDPCSRQATPPIDIPFAKTNGHMRDSWL